MRTKVRRRPNGRWYVYTIENGREKSRGGYPTQRNAKAAAKALEVDSSRGNYVEPSRLTVSEYLAEWLEARANADLSPNTREVERVIVRAWIVPYIGGVRLQKLSPRDVDRMDTELRNKGLRGKSRRNARGTLRKALSDAVRRGYVLGNVADAVDPPSKEDSTPRSAWTAAEARAFLQVAGSDRLGPVWRLALSSGMRRGELCGLRWDEVHGARITVRRQRLVRPARSWDQDRVYVRERTKSHRARVMIVDDQAAAELRRWKTQQATERLAFGPAYRDEGWVVAEADGSPVHPDTLSARWRRLERLASVRPIGLHGARHTHAELALAAGARIDVVSKQLGHASIAITADVYGHPDEEALKEAARRLADVLGDKKAGGDTWIN